MTELAQYVGNRALTEEQIQHVLSRMAAGITCRKACSEVGLSRADWSSIASQHPHLRRAHEQAQLEGADAMAESVVDVADEEPDPQRARVKSDNIKWYTSKINPRRYGDSLNLNVTETISLSAALESARERVINPERTQAIEHEEMRTDRQSVHGDELPDGLDELLK